jgi:DNA-3-methyladenine glycosylase II
MIGNNSVVPDYWRRAKRALARRDPVMAGIIRAHPRIGLRSRGDAFQTLARSIVGQQISVKAAQSVWNRLAGAVPAVAPEAVAGLRCVACVRAGSQGARASICATSPATSPTARSRRNAGRRWTTRR